MPIYEYHCKACDETFEIFQKMSDEPLGKCPKCGKRVKRLISQTSFALKGGGWYKDGYAARGGGAKTTSEKPATDKPKADGSEPKAAASGTKAADAKAEKKKN